MMEDWYRLIEDYNLGKLAAPAREHFEQAMASDPLLAEAVAQHRLEWELMELLVEKNLRADIQQVMSNYPARKMRWFHRMRWPWLIGSALIVALVVALGLFFQKRIPVSHSPGATPAKQDSLQNRPLRPVPVDSAGQKSPSPADQRPKTGANVRAIAVAAYRTPEHLSQIRGESQDTLSLAADAFAQKDYRRVIELLQLIPSDYRQEGLYLRAHARFHAGDYAGAEADFALLQTSRAFRQDAEWFGLLAKIAGAPTLENGAGKLLKKISDNPTHPYHADAAGLLNKIGGH